MLGGGRNPAVLGRRDGADAGIPTVPALEVGEYQDQPRRAGFIAPLTRKIAMRSALTLSPDRGGVFDVLLGLVRHGLGGRQGTGTQFVSWIHEADFVRAIDLLIAHEELSGVVNLASPNPLPNCDFMRALRDAWGIRVGLPSPKWIIEIGTWLMRTESELVLKSRRVVPGRLLAAGFQFLFPAWPSAARDLVTRWGQNSR